MEAWTRRLITALIGAAILAGCDGGQTGQPSSRPCDALMPTADFAHTFEGRHRVTLDWRRFSPDGGEETKSMDELIVSITYDGASPTAVRCGFSVVVVVEIATLRLGSLESGRGTLTVMDAPATRAELSFRGSVVNVSATIDRSDGASALSGTIEIVRSDQPGDVGFFPAR